MADPHPASDFPLSGESSPAPALLAAILYEDAATERCARDLIGRVLRMAGDQIPLEESMWSFDTLNKADGLAMAARHAGTADVVIIAAWRGSGALAQVTDWLQHWVAPRRERRGALVFINLEREDTGAEADRIEQRVAHAARQIGMDFFTTHIAPQADSRRREGAPPSPHESQPHPYDSLPASGQTRPHRR